MQNQNRQCQITSLSLCLTRQYTPWLEILLAVSIGLECLMELKCIALTARAQEEIIALITTHYGLYQQQITDIDTLITLLPVNYHSYRPRGSNGQYQRADLCILLEMVSEMKIPNFRNALRNKEKWRKNYKCLFTCDETLNTCDRKHILLTQTIKYENLSATTIK